MSRTPKRRSKSFQAQSSEEPSRRSWLERLSARELSSKNKHRRSRKASGALEFLEARVVLAASSSFGYLPTALAADQAGAALVQDSNLQGAWGVASAPYGGPVWVTDNATNDASRYVGSVAGSPLAANPEVAIPDGSPTGIVFNPTGDFVVGSGTTSEPATFLIASQNGAIDGWNPLLGNQATQAATASGAEFTGLAVGSATINNTSESLLYAADFKNDKIDVFDGTFKATSLGANAFTDSSLPAGYSPYNIELLNNELYVTYAKPDPANPAAPLAQAGNGVIVIFNQDGSLNGSGNFITQGNLNDPYGMAIAPPSTFGDYAGDLLVANGGDGHILAYNSSGAFQGYLNDGPGSSSPIAIAGVRGLAFGNGASGGAGNVSTLFYSAASGGHSSVGQIVNAFNQPLVIVPTSVTAAQGQAFSGTLAAFTDSDTTLPKDSFLAIINWGDGHSTAGSIVPNGSGGYNVEGVHTYATAGTRQVTLTVSDSTHNITATAVAAVADTGFTPAGTTFTGTENQAFSGSLGNFADPTGPGAASDYVANIQWGDGSSSIGTVTLTGSNTYNVQGSHTYTQVGSFSISAVVAEVNGTSLANIGTINSRSLISDPNTLTATATTFAATQGTSTTVAVATFTDSYAAATADLFTASINWGDGTVSAGQVSGSNGLFTVTGSHAFVPNGSMTVGVAINDSPGTATATATSTANVADGNTFAPHAMTFVAESGQSFSGAVALFPDANKLVRASDFTATIDWGDGSSSSLGSLTAANGTLTVSGTHTYATAGDSPAVTVSISENTGTATSTASSTALVPKGDVTGAGGTISATATTASSQQVLATFTPNAGNNATAFTADIDWGDGRSFTAGTVTLGANSTYTVMGSHTYATPGSFTPDVVVFESNAGGTSTPAVAISAAANIASPVVLTAATLTGTEHVSTSCTVATFTDTVQSLPASDFTATINWGDGTSTTTGLVSLNGGTYSVTGSHSYVDEGSFSVTVTVSETTPSAFSNTITSSASIAENDHFTTGVASVSATMGSTFSGPLAVFSDSDLTSTASDFHAVISWGDGQNDTSGTVTGGDGQFTVSGVHNFAQDGLFPLKVTIEDDSGLSGAAEFVATANATVMPGAGYVASPATFTATSGSTFTGTVATFTDTGSTNPSSDFSAQINWGDGTTSILGTVSGSNGTFTVAGSHAYAELGTYSVSVAITETAVTAVVSATSTASVSDGSVLSGKGGTVSATAGTTFSGAVGTFTDTNTLAPASDFTATIDWGDGTSATAGSVTGSGGTFTVSGSHLFAQAGSDALKITFNEKTPGTVSATATGAASVSTATSTATATISGEVFNDVNRNGTLDSGETGLAGVTVFLNVDGSGKPDSSNPSTTTGVNGSFSFTALAAGTYTVDEYTPLQGIHLMTTSPATVTLTAGQTDSGVMIGDAVMTTVVPVTKQSITPPAAASDANTAYVNALYQVILGRAPDAASLSSWVQQLTSGTSRASVAASIWNSTEHRTMQVEQFYEDFLNRAAEPAGLQYWTNLFDSWGDEQLEALHFFGSPEFQADHSGNTSLVDALYQDVDLRSADSAGESYWVNQLNSGTNQASDWYNVISAFIYGPEASTDVVDSFYSDYLHRSPDSADLQAWISALTSQTDTADQVAIAILSSGEFYNDVTANQAPQITSAGSTNFTAGTPGTFTVTTSGVPIGAISLASGSSLPSGVTLTDNKDGTATLASDATAAKGSYTFQLTASNSVGTAAKQNFTLAIS